MLAGWVAGTLGRWARRLASGWVAGQVLGWTPNASFELANNRVVCKLAVQQRGVAEGRLQWVL